MWILKNYLWIPYEHFEFTRLQSILFQFKTLEVRALMDEHKTYDKEKMLNNPDKDKKKRFIWSYIIKPVR